MTENSGTAMSNRAIVAHEPVNGQLNWKLEEVTLRELQSNELLVRIVASGICHTDLVFGLTPKEHFPYPKVLGHEGAGYVQKVGSKVQNAQAGDAVLLSFNFCSACKSCKDGHPSFCKKFNANYSGEQAVYQLADGQNSAGSFFGQSSFSKYAIVKEDSVVNVMNLVKDEEELKLFAPLGCGFQTGAGTINVLTAAGDQDSVVIMGLGGVGLTVIMAAKINKCQVIIGVDKVPARLELAKTFGATHVIDTLNMKGDLVSKIKAATEGNGSSITIDTTGNMELIGKGMDFTADLGQMIILGITPMDPAVGTLGVHLGTFMQTGKKLRGSIEGDVTPSEFIPKMIQWYREGKLPIDRIVKFYPASDFELAISEMNSGASVKPVLVW